MKLILSRRFKRDVRKIIKKNPNYKKRVNKTLKLLRQNPQHPSLRLHKLAGEESYSVSVDMSLRILVYVEKDEIYVYRLGDHDELY